MNRVKCIVYLLVSLVLIVLCGCQMRMVEETALREEAEEMDEQEAADDERTYLGVPTDDALPADSIKYLGAFRLPEDGNDEEHMFSWGGEAMAYNEHNNSLYIVGHSWHANVAEITIPELIVSKDIEQLNQAEVIQNFSDIKGKCFSDWGFEIPRAGIEVLDENLYFCFGEHYEEDTLRGTHGFTNLDLSYAEKTCIIGDNLYSTNDYIFAVPDRWQNAFQGNDLFTGRFRDGGWSGMGPSLYAVRSQDIINAQNDERITAQPLIQYDNSYNGDTGSKMGDYSHADSITGGAFVDCDAGSSVIFAATHGFGYTWYGFSNGVEYPIDGDDSTEYPDVPPYPHDERGWWNADFRAAIIMYAPDHLADVSDELIAPSDIQPYGIIDLTEYMLLDRDETDMQYLGGCAYDIAGNKLYVLELFADEDKPVVHVFTFE